MNMLNRILSLLSLFFVLGLAACGGGGGSSGTAPFPSTGGGGGTGTGGGTTTPLPTITLALTSATVAGGVPVTVSATVKDASGNAVANQVVTFSAPAALGTFSPSSALTDSSGVASVQLTAASTTTSGADQVVAAATVASVAITASTGFQVIPASGPVGTPSLALALSTSTVTTTTPATVTAAVRDANGAAVVGQVVSFSTAGGLGAFAPASALTDAGGNATVRLAPAAATTTGADRVVATTTINGTTLTTSQGFEVRITNADLILTLGSSQIPNTGSGSVAITVTAIDSIRNTVAGVSITFTADADAVIVGATAATGASGTATATLTIGANRANRLVTVTASSGAITRTATVQVVGTTITSTLVPAVILPGAAGEVQYRVVDQAGNPMQNQAVQIVATGLAPAQASGSTGANGDYKFSYASPTVPGSYTITANIGGSTDTQLLQVQSAGVIAPVTAAISAASISASPSVVSTNLAGSASNRSEIRALFVGANNQPIANVRARFDLAGDANSVGGTLTTGTTTLYSDANGVVTTAYVPGTRSSPTDGVSVRVCYGVSDTDPNFVGCLTSKRVTLTVTAEPLGVAIGTNETVIVQDLTYLKQFVVTVSDAAGVAKPDVNLAVSLDLPNYRKGFYQVVGDKWVKAGPLPSGDFAICVNEDGNRNGVLEAGEDRNGDGQLWPRKPDVIVSLLQSKTGADGTAVLQIQYAKDHGSWVDALITVTASGVSGSEGRALRSVPPVPVDSASIGNTTSDPAYKLSPYGIGSSCTSPN